ncbi:MAG TPA: N-acetylmuramoyl-L-alanine amidase [Nitrospiraceae bacterium]|nr:N-acetylmuramoyl-L-alanine amidase [Nitrospiraceae bacterium]
MTSRPRGNSFLRFLLIGVVFSMSFAWESAHADRRPSVSHPKPSASASQYPIIVRNIRTWSSRELTRLVLDLNKPPAYEVNESNPERVILEVKNTVLGKSSRLRVSGGTIPHPFQVSQSHQRVVTVAVARRQLAKHKIFALTEPDRLVIDVYHQPQEDKRPIGDVATAPAGAGASPAPTPVIPSPTVTESDGSATGRTARTVKTIVIDPGHGGKDPGTIGRHGTTEKDITLKIGLLLKELLAKQPNTKVFMTRERDVFVELEDRAKFANSKEADLFVSIHVNSHPHKGVRGLEIYHFGEAKDQRALEVAARENGTPLNSTGVGWEYLVADLLTSKKIEHSLELAWTAKQAMVSGLNGRYSTIDHGVKTAPFYVLRFTTMPGILAEIAFMSNPAEEEQLRTPAFLTHLAESISDGIQAYLQPSRLTSR